MLLRKRAAMIKIMPAFCDLNRSFATSLLLIAWKSSKPYPNIFREKVRLTRSHNI